MLVVHVHVHVKPENIDDMIPPEMIDKTEMLMKAAIDKNVHLYISINNRVAGNASIIAK